MIHAMMMQYMIITSAQILGYHPYYTGLVNQQCDQISQEPGYIIQIFNSQHGWIFIMVINNQYYD